MSSPVTFAAESRLHLATPHAPSIAARCWRAPDAKVGFVLVHGLESHAGWFEEMAAACVRGGASLLAYDRSGSGETPVAAERFSYTQATDELRAAVDALSREVPVVHLVGLSWGGLLALAAAADGLAGKIASVTLLAPALHPRRVGWRFRLSVALGVLFGRPRRLALPIQPEDFTKRRDKLAFVRRDPLRRKDATPVFLWETHKLQRRIRRLTPARAPASLTFFLAEFDALIDNDATLATAERLGADVRRFPGTYHSLVLEDPEGLAAALLDRAGLAAAPAGRA